MECPSEILEIKRHIGFFRRFLYHFPPGLDIYDNTRSTIIFFSISGLDLLNALDTIKQDKEEIIEWIYSLQVLPRKDGDETVCGFQGSTSFNQEALGDSEFVVGHIALTYTSLATLVILGDDLSRVNKKSIMKGVRALQQENGSFCCTLKGSENDMRFVYCAATVCYILQDWSGMDVQKAVEFIKSSISYDFGISQGPHNESHGGATFCGIAALKLMGQLDKVLTPIQRIGLQRWGLKRQEEGFNGRANKQEDSCYSFWIGSMLKIIDSFQFVNFEKNRQFLMTTQHATGGFSKWTSTCTDPLHTYLGLGGLSLMGEEGLLELNPALNITKRASDYLDSLHAKWRSENNMQAG